MPTFCHPSSPWSDRSSDIRLEELRKILKIRQSLDGRIRCSALIPDGKDNCQLHFTRILDSRNHRLQAINAKLQSKEDFSQDLNKLVIACLCGEHQADQHVQKLRKRWSFVIKKHMEDEKDAEIIEILKRDHLQEIERLRGEYEEERESWRGRIGEVEQHVSGLAQDLHETCLQLDFERQESYKIGEDRDKMRSELEELRADLSNKARDLSSAQAALMEEAIAHKRLKEKNFDKALTRIRIIQSGKEAKLRGGEAALHALDDIELDAVSKRHYCDLPWLEEKHFEEAKMAEFREADLKAQNQELDEQLGLLRAQLMFSNATNESMEVVAQDLSQAKVNLMHEAQELRIEYNRQRAKMKNYISVIGILSGALRDLGLSPDMPQSGSM